MSERLSKTFLGATQHFWEERRGHPISAEDAAESIRSVGELFALLSRWDAKDQQVLGDTDGTRAPDDGTKEGVTG